MKWYHQKRLLRPSYDRHYTESRREGSNSLVLFVERMGAEVLGLYTVVVTVGRVTKRASVTLKFSSTLKLMLFIVHVMTKFELGGKLKSSNTKHYHMLSVLDKLRKHLFSPISLGEV